ncbi:MAG TPA: DUF255 domain-containing protein [Bacteriovoracaceae bacterium]|nr:DUF255 domain-containing protein [Bacteriovoracaceae bacterium]
MNQNKLANEQSLYLKQHINNPVAWFPYGNEALNKARTENKLIFLSIGYSSCHWCHVMNEESFEDQETADFLNEHFISIKVDREEYPDLDNYYQNVCTLLTGRGGWPLSVFLTPEGKAFFAGTYFPKVSHDQSPSFMDVLKSLQNHFKENPEEIKANSERLTEDMKKGPAIENKIKFDGHFPPPSAILNALKNYADTTNGGYGKAPKFPHFSFYEWACEQILEGMIPKEQGQHIVESLEKMLMGGVYDHLKGGIHRYSVDEKYLIPHFEKMLYDQAGLLRVLSKVGQFYPAPVVFDGLLQTLDYLKTEMLSDDGYFFSAQDADSEGVEGLYFTFTKEEFEQSFEDAPPEQRARIDHYLEVFNITEKGNFEHGLNVISLNPKFKNEFYTQDGWQEIREIRRRLLDVRKLRLPPATDRKGIASWNYMMIAALCDVIQFCPIDIIQAEAFGLIQATVEGCIKQFIHENNGRHILKHVNTIDQNTIYLEDYVNFCDAQLRLYEITGNETFKANAIEGLDFAIQNFIKDGVIYTTALEAPTVGIDNLPSPLYDQSYHSSAMLLVHLLRRAELFDKKFNVNALFPNFEEFAQFALLNPLGHGMALRTLTYPGPIYRKIEVPQKWLQNPEFLEIRSHFFSRFLMSYHHEENEKFQICNAEACEVANEGFENFKKLFTMNKEENA